MLSKSSKNRQSSRARVGGFGPPQVPLGSAPKPIISLLMPTITNTVSVQMHCKTKGLTNPTSFPSDIYDYYGLLTDDVSQANYIYDKTYALSDVVV